MASKCPKCEKPNLNVRVSNVSPNKISHFGNEAFTTYYHVFRWFSLMASTSPKCE
jgi:hypothetical protein